MLARKLQDVILNLSGRESYQVSAEHTTCSCWEILRLHFQLLHDTEKGDGIQSGSAQHISHHSHKKYCHIRLMDGNIWQAVQYTYHYMLQTPDKYQQLEIGSNTATIKAWHGSFPLSRSITPQHMTIRRAAQRTRHNWARHLKLKRTLLQVISEPVEMDCGKRKNPSAVKE